MGSEMCIRDSLKEYVQRYPQLETLELKFISVFDQKTGESVRYLPLNYAQMSTMSDVFAQVGMSMFAMLNIFPMTVCVICLLHHYGEEAGF